MSYQPNASLNSPLQLQNKAVILKKKSKVTISEIGALSTVLLSSIVQKDVGGGGRGREGGGGE